MKLLSLILFSCCLSLFSFKADAPKQLKVVGSLQEWNKHFNKLETIKIIIDASNLPHQEVEFVKHTIDSLEMFIVPQLQKQIDSTKAK